MNGGTSFERGVELDPSGIDPSLAQGNTGLMQSIVARNKTPRITVKFVNHNKATKLIYDCLPDTLVTNQRYARFIGYYREMLAQTYCRDDAMYTDLLCDVLLSNFPRALEYPDIMDALIIVWEDKLSKTPKSQRRENLQLLKIFEQVFFESCFTLMQCANLPPQMLHDLQRVMDRSAFIADYVEKRKVSSDNPLLAAGNHFKPLTIDRIAFDVMKSSYANAEERES